MLKEMEEIRAKGEFCLLTGDLNKLVGNDEFGVPGNSSEVSPGGRLLRSLLATKDWVLVNGMDKEVVKGGPFTRKDPASGKLSCLDLFVISKELRPYVSSLMIDSKKEMAVARAVKQRGKPRLIYSDHFSCLLTFENLPRRRTRNEGMKKAVWNLGKEGGWQVYEDLTEKASKKVESVMRSDLSIEEKIEKFYKIHEKIKFGAFGKVELKRNQTNKQTKMSEDEKDLDAEELFKEQIDIAEAEIEDIKTKGKSKVGKVWELKKKILGVKKGIEANAIVNPKTGKIVCSQDEIKKVSLEYCKNTLESNKPEKEYEKLLQSKDDQVKREMADCKEPFEVKYETFEKVVAKFKKSNKRNYDFLVKADKSFQDSVFTFCRSMIESETFPRDFKDTTLHMIFKGKGKKENLSDNRFIHSKPWLPRLVEGLIVEEGLKEALVNKSSMFQIGGQPGHRPEEHMFVMKSLIAKTRAEGKPIVVQCWDISKFFDKERIGDAILTCVGRNANKKATKLWLNLNENTKIKVKTGVGLSKEALVGAVVGQGTIGGALVSQAVLDDGVMQHFTPGGDNELWYGEVPMAPVMLQDDLMHGAKGAIEARSASEKVDKVMKERGLHLSEDKCIYVVMGTKKQKEKLRSEFEINPLMCGKVKMKPKESEKWLGQQISGGGLADSAAATVAAREPKIRGACLEIANIVNDWRSQAIGGMETAIILWEALCIPSLLHGAGTWTQISAATEKKLEQLQQWFIRLVLQVGQGAPLASLGWETGLLSMKLRIWREKLMMVMHIRQLGDDTLAKKVYTEQVNKGYPGLAKETAQISKDLHIEDCNKTTMTKAEYKILLSQLLQVKDESMLRDQAKDKSKCERILKDRYGKKEYLTKMTIGEVRKFYRTRVGLLPFASNYKNDKRFARTNWMCRCKTEKENQSHIRQCPIYSDITQKYPSVDDYSDLVKYLREVLNRRDLIDSIDEQEDDLQQ